MGDSSERDYDRLEDGIAHDMQMCSLDDRIEQLEEQLELCREVYRMEPDLFDSCDCVTTPDPDMIKCWRCLFRSALEYKKES